MVRLASLLFLLVPHAAHASCYWECARGEECVVPFELMDDDGSTTISGAQIGTDNGGEATDCKVIVDGANQANCTNSPQIVGGSYTIDVVEAASAFDWVTVILSDTNDPRTWRDRVCHVRITDPGWFKW